ncbi:MAG TPA: CHASE domain-containing protein [Elusimicrobiota bacterium]|nr:CHASE domain-containing protein [Elusimicrobiota bacterium]
MGRWRASALLALAYFTAARLSLLLAIPPGYSTIVWPAAGIALSALWIWGIEAWPGVFAGSCLANAAMAWSRGDASLAPYLFSVWIGAGAAAQAVVATLLIRRACDGRDLLAEENDLFRFLLLGGPAACLVSSAWASAGMRLFGEIASRELAFSWATWWVGDSIGVVTCAPLILLWNGRGPAASRRAKLAVAAAFAAIVAGVASVQHYAIRDEEKSVRASAASTLEDVWLTLRVGLAGHLDALQSAADFLASDHVTRKQFARFARGALERHPGMLALEWRPRVTDARRREVEESARADGLKGFVFREIDGRTPRARAPVYFPVLYVEPVAGNERALGVDIGPDSIVRDAASTALASGAPAASEGFPLVRAGGRTGIVALTPSRSAPGAEPKGLVEGVFVVDDMIGDLLAGIDKRELSVRLYDDTPPGPPRLLYARGPHVGPSPEALSVTGGFAGRRWRFELLPTANFAARRRSPLSWFVLFGSLLFSYLVGWVVLTLYERGEKARITA